MMCSALSVVISQRAFSVAQEAVKRSALQHLMAACGGCSADSFRWQDEEGASLVRTLSKAWGGKAPQLMICPLKIVVELGMQSRTENPTASESCALGVAHLLPALLECVPG